LTNKAQNLQEKVNHVIEKFSLLTVIVGVWQKILEELSCNNLSF
jgi:hypothetical protein